MRYFIFGCVVGYFVGACAFVGYRTSEIERLSKSELRAIRLVNLYASVIKKHDVRPDRFEAIVCQMLFEDS